MQCKRTLQDYFVSDPNVLQQTYSCLGSLSSRLLVNRYPEYDFLAYVRTVDIIVEKIAKI